MRDVRIFQASLPLPQNRNSNAVGCITPVVELERVVFFFRVSWPFDLSGISVRADSFGRVFMFISTIREGMRRIEVLEVCAVVGRG